MQVVLLTCWRFSEYDAVENVANSARNASRVLTDLPLGSWYGRASPLSLAHLLPIGHRVLLGWHARLQQRPSEA